MTDLSTNGSLVRLKVGETWLECYPEAAVAAGFTGRSREAIERHIAELEAEGVPRPDRLPSFYPLPTALLTQANELRPVHAATSGEAEIALLLHDEERFVTLASDHTDRRAEGLDIGVSKLVCPKPLARVAWRYEELADHWDELQLRSWIWEDGGATLYQDAAAATILPPEEILAALPLTRPTQSLVVLTGSVPVRGRIRGSSRFAAELVDPVLNRSIRLDYAVRVLDLFDVTPSSAEH